MFPITPEWLVFAGILFALYIVIGELLFNHVFQIDLPPYYAMPYDYQPARWRVLLLLTLWPLFLTAFLWERVKQ